MKARGLVSPNRADSLVLSFAYPVSKKQKNIPKRTSHSGSGWVGQSKLGVYTCLHSVNKISAYHKVCGTK